MADEKKTPAAPKVAAPVKPPREEIRGAWVVVDDGLSVLVVESSELKAFRAAQPFRGRVVFWAFGKSVSEALADLSPTSEVPFT